MSENNRRRAGTIALLLGFIVLYFIIVLTAIHAVGTDDGLYYSEQTFQDKLPSWDIEANYGITDDELRTLDQQLADYLRGDETALTPGDPFNEREMAHMKDCFDLFDLLRKVRSRLIPWAIVLRLVRRNAVVSNIAFIFCTLFNFRVQSYGKKKNGAIPKI